ncbi:Phosphoserine phosphatase SerB2 [Zhongshania aliphaticivorans]|uniref:Phosphoserine phosphatase n=1 Tax=Zhongshania aliphaticivorans TaxID=1470434 RepID=A0A5S9MX72_9GAMM|nr:phosphoserine phosphatase SerB [Zhongshania aliphaticivorans]CAA0081751.1 Phosphoserine phosphatase SerB2 [Zhongshania aliphaticivorans]CAA0084776.1 Phosphoserine phosphatase SerB2 [Zhongshania aliphaticivorans]
MNDIILINIAGDDRPGVTSTITSILADHQVNILDIGQAVIHDNLTLGLLVEVPAGAEAASILKDILFRTHEMGMQVRFLPVSPESYNQWVSGQGKQRHIVTLLARKITARHIAGVTDIVSRYSLNIDRIDRLSGRVPLEGVAQQSKASVELSVRGNLPDATDFRRELLHLASEMDIDIAYQEDNMFRRTRRLVAFDMDSTLIEAEVIDELAIAAGVGEQVVEITERAMRGEIDFTESFKARVALLKGLDESVLEGIAQSLRITEGAENLVSTLKQLGYKTAILSGGFTYFGQYLQRKLGIDYVHANELVIRNGQVTGEVEGIVVDGKRKAELLREIAQREGLDMEQVIAVGDGANDLPMLSIAGLGIAFRAKPIVRENAKQSISTLGLDGILYLLGISDRLTGK